jgi:hypothetical protein
VLRRLSWAPSLPQSKPLPQGREHVTWGEWGPQVEEVLFMRFLQNRKLPLLPAIHPSLPSFVISPRSSVTHRPASQQETSSGDWRWPWPGTHIRCLFSHLSSGQPRPPTGLAVDDQVEYEACRKYFWKSNIK